MKTLQQQSLSQQWWRVLLVAGVALLIWLPRGFGLDGYATADENAWLTRSANFYRALARGDWGGTFQRHHPGVTLTWAGTLGFLTTYPAYVDDTNRDFGWVAEEISPFLREQGYAPMALLAAGRRFVVLAIVAALTLTFLFAWRLWGVWPALVGTLLLAFDPFHIAHSRLLHLDGLLSSFLILAVVGLLVALTQEERAPWQRSALITAGVAAGLAWLTRSPGLFLLPFAGLLGLFHWVNCVRQQPQARNLGKTTRFLIGTLIAWGTIGGVTVFLLWPALWVDPWGSLGQVLNAANEYATEGHADPIFFNGAVYNGDPGFWFYPVSWLWRVTPVVLIGLVVGLLGLIWPAMLRLKSQPDRGSALKCTDVRMGSLVLLLLALLFTLFMNLGAKKFDRYLLPVYPALDLVAGFGWVAAASWVQRRWSQRGVQIMAGVAVTLVIVAQVVLALPHYPYYLTYYNPLLGGSGRAPTVMQIGRGEGANLAAQFLNAQSPNTNSQLPITASSFPNGPFSYFYQGRTVPHTFWTLADYGVVYAQDFQRRMPSPRQIAWVERLTPIERINLHGIDYAQIYDLRAAPIPPFVTTWAQAATPQIRLNAYELTAGSVQPGEAVRTTFYLENLVPITDDLNVLVRLIGADGGEIARSEGWPWGAPTSTWQPGEIRPDGHTLQIPETAAPGLYRLEIGFYAPESGAILSAVQSDTGAQLPDLVPLDFIQVGDLPIQPAVPLNTPYGVGDWATLIGYTTETSTGRQIDVSRTPLLPGENLELTLFWQVENGTETNYTAFVHVVDSNGTLLTQQDQPPLAGFLPTSLWRKGQIVADRYTVSIPDGAALGTYNIRVGLYDLATLARLPVLQDGVVTGDSVPLTRVVIALSRMDELQGTE